MAQVTKSSHPIKHYSKGGCVKGFADGTPGGVPAATTKLEVNPSDRDSSDVMDAAGGMAKAVFTPPKATVPAAAATDGFPQGAPNRVGTSDKGLAPEATPKSRGMTAAQYAASIGRKP